MNVSNRKVHKFIGLVVSVQLLLWTISGIFFSFNKIDQIRGENYLKSVEQITPEKISRISFDEAKEIVIKKTYLKPISVEEITEEKRGSEFRGRNLPLYKLSSLDAKDKEVNVYIDPSLGKIVAIRTFEWRLWDLMWGLHIMDWRDRDDINNLFLKIFSILALISSITGIVLFFRPKSKA